MSGTTPAPPPPDAPMAVPTVGGGRAPFSAGSKIAIGGAAVAVILLLLALNQSGFHHDDRGGGAGGSGGAGAVRRIELPSPDGAPAATTAASTMPARTSEVSLIPKSRPRQIKPAAIMAWEDKASAQPAVPTAAVNPGEAADAADDPLAARLRATRAETAHARRLGDPDLTLTMGTIVPCSPQQPLNTQLPGFLSCVVPTEVRGQTGRVVLLDPGTRIVGQVQRSMQHGQDRAFVLWTRAETPGGVVVDLASPGTDAMGTNGLDVDVHTNFWARFGGAIMLSFLDAGLQAAALGASNAISGGRDGNNNVSFTQMQSGGRSAATTALDATVNIPPYGTRDVGVPAAVFLAKDLDFSGVYSLRRTGG